MVVGGACVYFGLTCLLEGQVLWAVILLVASVIIGGAVTG